MQIAADVASWAAARPEVTRDFQHDADGHSKFWLKGYDLLAALPDKPQRTPDEAGAAETILTTGRASREAFLRKHVQALYAALTRNQTRHVRAEPLAYEAASLIPGLMPTRAQVEAQSRRVQRDKDGIEIDQGIFFANVLADPQAGAHFCHAMLLPRAEALAHLPELQARGAVDLGTAAVKRQGKATIVFMRNPRYLNAEDEATLQQTETAVDLAILDPVSELCVLRGDTVDNPKYAGKRVFSTGINLTHLYHGRISYMWYVTREMGFVNKMMRGLARADEDPDEIFGGTHREAVGRGRGAFRDRRRLPVPAHHGLRGGGERRLHDTAGAQGRHHPGRRQHADVALHRRPHRPAGDHGRATARLRHAGRPHDLRRDRAAGRDGRGARSRHRELHRLRRRERGG